MDKFQKFNHFPYICNVWVYIGTEFDIDVHFNPLITQICRHIAKPTYLRQISQSSVTRS